MYRSITLNDDITIRRYRAAHRFLRSAIDVYRHLIARTKDIVLRCGNVHDRVEAQVLIGEDIPPEDFMTFIASHHGKGVRHHGPNLILEVAEVGIILIILLLPLWNPLQPLCRGGIAASVSTLCGITLLRIALACVVADTIVLPQAARTLP